jgi:AcrR family transcriptional regulator
VANLRASGDEDTYDREDTGVTGTTEVAVRLRRAVLHILIEKGLAGLKTAEIARRAQTTESTLFRHFESRELLLLHAVDWCWATLNEALAQAAFDAPVAGSPSEVIQRDFNAIWQMFDAPRTRLAGTVAFLSHRRPRELLGDRSSSAYLRYEGRLTGLCRDLLNSYQLEGDSAATPLSLFLTNYAAAIWFTWLADEDRWKDPDYPLNPAYAQAGLSAHLEGLCRRSTFSKSDIAPT